MLENVLKYLKNWFRVRDDVDGKHYGTFEIKNGKISLPFLLEGQYFRMIGSVLNTRQLYIYGDEITDGDGKAVTLKDETFEGCIWSLAVPQAVIEIAQEADDWQTKYGAVVASPYTSESYFGQYSYSKAAGGSTSSGGAGGWENAFASRLMPYKKISED